MTPTKIGTNVLVDKGDGVGLCSDIDEGKGGHCGESDEVTGEHGIRWRCRRTR